MEVCRGLPVYISIEVDQFLSPIPVSAAARCALHPVDGL